MGERILHAEGDHSNEIADLNERLRGKIQRRVNQILRMRGFERIKISILPQLTHIVSRSGFMAIEFSHNGFTQLIEFDGEIVYDEISAHLSEDGGGLKGFIIRKGSKYFLYKITKDFPTTGKTEKIANGIGDGSFGTEEEVKKAIKLFYGV